MARSRVTFYRCSLIRINSIFHGIKTKIEPIKLTNPFKILEFGCHNIIVWILKPVWKFVSFQCSFYKHITILPHYIIYKFILILIFYQRKYLSWRTGFFVLQIHFKQIIISFILVRSFASNPVKNGNLPASSPSLRKLKCAILSYVRLWRFCYANFTFSS